MPEIMGKIRSVMEGQRFAVLATESGGEPYTNLVAFAGTGAPHELVFITPRESTKYRNIAGNDRVSIFIDDRGNSDADIGGATGITLAGRAAEITGPRRDELLSLYLARHHYLSEFGTEAGNALILVKIIRYVVVSGFRSVEVISVDDGDHAGG